MPALKLALLMLAVIVTGASAQNTAKSPTTIRVVTDNAYAPYSFQSEEGKLQGILIDQWQEWEKKTGIKVELHGMDWGKALRGMQAGEFDVIDLIVETPERQVSFDFTSSYTPVEASIFFRKEISGISDIASLKGFPIGVKTGDQHVDKLKASGITTLIFFPSNDAIVEAAKQRKINVFVADDPSALYLLNKAGIHDDFRHSAPIFRDEIRRAVRKGNTLTLRLVSEGFAAIEPAKIEQINEKWFGRTINRISRFVAFAGYAIGGAVLIIVALIVWSSMLRKRVLHRTAALSESEQRFRRLVELMPVAVYMCDTSGTIQSYNDRAVELWGRAPKLGDPKERYCGSFRLYSADGKYLSHEESPMVHVLGNESQARNIELVMERPDGSRITVLVNIAPLKSSAGKLIGAMNCFQDITERKEAENKLRQSERELRLSIDTIPAMAWIILPDGTLDFINQRWREYTGLSLQEALKNSNATVYPEDLPKVLEHWEKDMAAGRPFEDEMRLRRADGEFRWFLVRTAPLFDEHGKIVRWYGTSTDIEDLKRAEEALLETQAALARVSRTTVVGELTASIAHEVNQPLAAVVTNAGAALRWLESEPPNLVETRAALQRIVRDGNRASEVVARIRSLLENGAPAKTSFNISEPIAEIVSLTDADTQRHRVTVQIQVAENLPEIMADRVQLQQVLMNLTMNALDALGEVTNGERILTIRAEKASSNTMLIAVQDNGVGIVPDNMKHIFEPFYTTKKNGLGLGLSISRSIIEAHGGHLWATPNTGAGMTFQFTLPVQMGGTT